MKIFIFSNTSLDSGYLISGEKNKVVELSTLRDCDDVLFVLPNEFLSYIKHTAELKNKKNLHASIINSINTIEIENQSELEVLECNNSNDNFFIIAKNKLEKLKDRFKHIDSKIKITSDLLFFREIFKTNIGFNESIFYEEGDSLVKLTKKAFGLLDKADEKISYKTIDDLNSEIGEAVTFHEFDSLNIQNIFNFNASKKFIYAGISLVVLLNLIGLFNISSNWGQIKKMNQTLSELYLSIYPNEKIDSIETQIIEKINSLQNQSNSTTAQITELILNISKTTKIIEITYKNDLKDSLNIKCLFKNEAEEELFIAQQQRINKKVSVISRTNSKDFLLTEFNYEL
jgi:dUTPase|tara:strand:- start:2726 stop:3757 length:1032 start_codon:yes stop_codon:yes gene_type:complete